MIASTKTSEDDITVNPPTYKSLRAQWEAERSLPDIVKLPSVNFLEQCEKLRESLFETKSDALSNLITRRFWFLEQDLKSIRLEKMLNSILLGAEIDRFRLSPSEEKLYDLLKDAITNYTLGRGEITKIIEQMPISSVELRGDLQAQDSEFDHDYNLVRIMSPLIPKFLGIDGVEYGPLKAEDVVRLPFPNAMGLIRRGAAKELKVDL